ncbi:hypothetical protein BUALT_Bualt05G0070400 [Buddleja alternifolia]|uniref:UBC core domain-containing protein n=1 Tax=Buddleja alternifolia TaxID=168488 RepID=A0AAV6XLK7_9LAMI|nr:hypothetical protein BUALT_Bualt05G0070400 [Buddleja alternifolia]
MQSHGMDGDGWSTRTASTQSSEDSLGSKENALTVDPFKVDDDVDEESDGMDVSDHELLSDDFEPWLQDEKQIRNFKQRVRPVNNNDFHWEARMMGPMNSQYADHFFKLIIRFGPNFSLSPPLVLQRIRQLMAEPNVNAPHPSSTQALQLYLDDHDSDTGERDSQMQRYWDGNEFEEDQEKNISIV